jgi:hypothetical protein
VDAPNEFAVIGEFGIRMIGLRSFLPEILLCGQLLFEPTQRRRTKPKKGKKKRRKREPWFGRRKRARWKERPVKEQWEWADTKDEWIADWIRSNAHQFLHLSGFQREFDDICTKLGDSCSLFWDISEILDTGWQSKINCQSWGFLNVGELLTDVDDSSLHFESLDSKFIRMQSIYFTDKSDVPIVFDTGATIAVTPYEDDFISWHEPCCKLTLRGINSDCEVKGFGEVEWTLYDDNGIKRKIRTTAYWVPSATVRLFSPQAYFNQVENKGTNGGFSITTEGCTFKFPKQPGERQGRLTFAIFEDRLPLAYVVHRRNDAALNVLNDVNVNLTTAQKELLRWHFKLGHFNLRWIQSLTRIRKGETEPVLPTRTKANSCDIPHCAACQFAKAKRQSEGDHTDVKDPKKDGVLKDGVLRPGQVVSTDQFVSKVRGRLPKTYGKEKDKEKYQGGTVFIDMATGFMYVQNQVSLGAAETLRAKHQFEREARNCGVPIESYRGDNGVYRTTEFQKDLYIRGQTMSFSGVGAHHQNGTAEKAIRTISESSRAMMLHAALHWPEQMSLDLWPFAIDYAVYLWNRMPRMDSGVSPLELFCGCKVDTDVLRTSRVWGCPAYVLDPTIQDGKKLPRWKPKSRRGQFLGRSKIHASTIGLIRNLRTGSVSTQFHVVYDDWFTTVPVEGKSEEEINPELWQELLAFQREQATEGLTKEELEKVPKISEEWLDERELEQRKRIDATNRQLRNTVPAAPRDVIPEQDGDVEDAPPIVAIDDDSDDESEASGVDVEGEDVAGEDQPPARPQRQRRPNPRYYGPEFVNVIKDSWENRGQDYKEAVQKFRKQFGLITREDAYLATLPLENLGKGPENFEASLHAALMQVNIDEDGCLEGWHPFAFAAKANSEDTPTFHEAMNGPDAEEFYKAMCLEIEQLESMDPWDIVPISETKGKNILDSTWAFKRKRYPDGKVRKLKARWCVRGDQQLEGIDYFDTYAPVVAWSTVRLLLVLSVVLNLATRQVDYTLAFVHADLHDEVYVRMPKLFEKEGHVFKLKKSVYGLKQAPLNFFNTLKEGLEARGFKQMKNLDPCLFQSKDVIVLTYVDDCLFFSKSESAIDSVIESLRRPEPVKFLLNVEEDVAGFLGILIDRTRQDGSIELLQTGLIDRILDVMGLQDSKANSTPASPKTLGKDENGDPCCERWSYGSVVGMMMYLSSNSRPDIAFAVHQCARFTHCPKRSHEQALKQIARYLKGTKNRGMVIKPSTDLTLDLWCDADFAGLWNSEDARDPSCVKSRAGYVITLGETPVLWGSKLIPEICLSTTESEYIALSMAMRQLLPLRRTIQELAKTFGIGRTELTKISTVWEDNNGCIKMANSEYPNMTPRSKHIAVKYHWFHSQLSDATDGICVKRVDTNLQKADCMTKGLKPKDFVTKRKMIMGW